MLCKFMACVNSALIFNEVSYIWRKAETFSIGQGEQFVIVQNRVQVFHPFGINIAIKDNPLTFLQLSSHIVYDPKNI